MAERQAIVGPKPKACAQCPWRLENQGKPHPHAFYAKANLARLWRGLRDGERMTCHPTDPEMAEFEGYESTADRAVTCECAGALTLIQRELAHFVQACHDVDSGEGEGAKSGLQLYRKRRPRGLTKAGLATHIFAMQFATNPLTGRHAETVGNLADTDIGYPPLGEFSLDVVQAGVKARS
jgi:hypothetical protein